MRIMDIMKRVLVAVLMISLLLSGTSVCASKVNKDAAKSKTEKSGTVHGWSDVSSVDFYAVRDAYGGVDDIYAGLGARFVFKDGTTFEYDGLYRWDPQYCPTEGKTEEALLGDGGGWSDGDEPLKISWFCEKIDMTVSGAFDKTDLMTKGIGNLTLKLVSNSKCPISINDTVIINVVENPIKKIDPIGPSTGLREFGNIEIDENGNQYTFYSPFINGLLVTYNNGNKEVIGSLDEDTWYEDDPEGSSYMVGPIPEGKACYGSKRYKCTINSNQSANHWKIGEQYPVSISYCGVKTTFVCTVSNDMNECPTTDIFGFDDDARYYKNVWLGETKLDASIITINNYNGEKLKPGIDYDVMSWYEVSDDGYYRQTKLDNAPSKPGEYWLVLLGLGDYSGAKGVSVRVLDPKDILNYSVKSKTNLLLSDSSNINAEKIIVFRNSDKEDIALTPNVDYKVSGWYEMINHYEGAEEANKDEDYRYIGNPTKKGFYYVKINGIGDYRGKVYVGLYVNGDSNTENNNTKDNNANIVNPTNKSKPNGLSEKNGVIRKIVVNRKSLKVFWKKINGAMGYEIKYSTSKKFKKAKKITIKKAKTTSRKIKKLKSKKKYYIRIRAYTINDGKKLYSKWSKTMVKMTK